MSRKDTPRKVFVPLTDELLYDHPELITAPLRPFNADQPCFHWLGAGDKTANNIGNNADIRKRNWLADWMANWKERAEIEIIEPEKPAA